jgi:hypothetical protein
MTRPCAICSAPLLATNRTGLCAECILTARNGDLDGEAWLPVVGHVGFEISNEGRVRDARTKEIRQPDWSGRYPRVSLNGRRRAVHLLMAESWLGPRPWGRLVCHADDDPANLALPNLSYGTRRQNALDAIRNRAGTA